MGNSISKKKSSHKQKRKHASKVSSPPRLEVTTADNENSVNTAQSVSSILITSSQHGKSNNNNNASALSQLNPDYPLKKSSEEYNEQDTIGPGPDPFMGKVEHPQQHKLLAQSDFWPPKKASGQLDVEHLDSNQLTVSSMNQLTMNSVSSMNMGAIPIDDYIKRLLDAGYASKVSKQLCLKQSEVNSICRTAMDIFLGQPVRKGKKGKKNRSLII